MQKLDYTKHKIYTILYGVCYLADFLRLKIPANTKLIENFAVL